MSHTERDNMAEDTPESSQRLVESSEERASRIDGHYDDLARRFGLALPNVSGADFDRLSELLREIAKEKVGLEDESGYDHLTGLLNRKGFYRRLDNEVRRQHRTLQDTQINSTELGCFLFIDLDYFGDVNKKFGDEQGDITLVKIGKIFSNTRPEDAAARWGGEEFLIYTPDGLVDAILMAQRLRQLTEIQVSFPDPSRHLTFSVGISKIPTVSIDQLFDTSFMKDNIFPQQINLASIAMRKGAKDEGRNRIAIMDAQGLIQEVNFQVDPEKPNQPKISFRQITGIPSTSKRK